MTTLTLVLMSLVPVAGDGVSSDDLDAFVDRAVLARKACGPTAVCYCLNRLGVDVRLQDVWRRADIGPEGVNLNQVLALTREYGIDARAVVANASDLESLPIPSILVVHQSHCVVYDGLEGGGTTVRVFEPANMKLLEVPSDEVRRIWSGQAVVFPDPSLRPSAFWSIAAASALALFVAARVAVGGIERLRRSQVGESQTPELP